jgi:hypothetical protein
MLLFALVAGLFVWMDISVRRLERRRPVAGQTFSYAAE